MLNPKAIASWKQVLARARKLHKQYTDKGVLGSGQMDALLLAMEVISYMEQVPYLELIGGVDEEISD